MTQHASRTHADVSQGFAAPVIDAQATFRAIMMAMAEPGTTHDIVRPVGTCSGFSPAMAAVALTLADFETRLWIDPGAASAAATYLRFHTGAPIVDAPEQAAFAFVTDAARLPQLSAFAQGSLEYPDTSTTVVIDVAHLEMGRGFRLTGPGIAGVCRLSVDPLPTTFADDLANNRVLFPCGFDLIFCQGTRIAALPRSTRVERG